LGQITRLTENAPVVEQCGISIRIIVVVKMLKINPIMTNKKLNKNLHEKVDYIFSRMDKEGDITVCDICGELMVAPLGFDLLPICSKIDCNYKFLKSNE